MNKPGPELKQYYHPLEKPNAYPLELCKTDGRHLEICLWFADGRSKYVIAYWIPDSEGYDLKFVGERPLMANVDWNVFKRLAVQGTAITYRWYRQDYNRRHKI